MFTHPYKIKHQQKNPTYTLFAQHKQPHIQSFFFSPSIPNKRRTTYKLSLPEIGNYTSQCNINIVKMSLPMTKLQHLLAYVLFSSLQLVSSLTSQFFFLNLQALYLTHGNIEYLLTHVHPHSQSHSPPIQRNCSYFSSAK